MAKRYGDDLNPATKPKRSHPGVDSPRPIEAPNDSRMDHLVGLVDHCTSAKESADKLGEKFLSYLLAMTIQEGRAAMRRIGAAKSTIKR